MSAGARVVDGIVLVNKPQGLTSNAVLQRVKRIFRAKKAGHTGSLDPLATGMLPICLGEATKFSQFLLDADKSYDVTGLLGVTTDTGDSMGQVIARMERPVQCSDVDLDLVLNQFRGPIQQVPPMYSALKHQGKPLYKYARAGVTLDRPAREVVIHDLHLRAFDGETISLTVRCSKGTYIRSLVESIGHALGVGGHVTQLHRRFTAGFENEPMVTLALLEEMSEEDLMSLLLSPARAVSSLPELRVTESSLSALRHGQRVEHCLSNHAVGCFRLYDEQDHFMGLGEVQADGTLVSKRLIAF